MRGDLLKLFIISLSLHLNIAAFYMACSWEDDIGQTITNSLLFTEENIFWYDSDDELCTDKGRKDDKKQFVLTKPENPVLSKIMDPDDDGIVMDINWSYMYTFYKFGIGECEGDTYQSQKDSVTYKELNDYLTEKIPGLIFLK
jgi:hypothetical protein